MRDQKAINERIRQAHLKRVADGIAKIPPGFQKGYDPRRHINTSGPFWHGGMPERYADEEVFVEGSTYCRGKLKARILKKKLLSYVCEECGMGPEWNGKVLVLHLDHKNGINNDNRLKNLRFLCPNCHTQTETYSRTTRL